MNLEKTKVFYSNMKMESICDCAYCQNYVKQIRETYPEVESFLQSIGVEVEMPFETCPLEPQKGYLDYIGVQYIVMGKKEGFESIRLDGVNIDITESHPNTEIEEEHFVIEVHPIRLKWEE